jgi:hypothetical protein
MDEVTSTMTEGPELTSYDNGGRGTAVAHHCRYIWQVKLTD